MLEGKPRPIVRGVDHIGVLCQLQLIKRIQQPSHLGINVLNGVDVGPVRVRVADIVGHIERNVWHRVGQIDKERLVLMICDEVNRCLRVAAGDRSLVDGQFDNFLVLDQGRFPFRQRRLGIVPESVHPVRAALRLALVIGIIHVIGVGNAEVGIEPIGPWQHLGLIAQVPLAEAGGGIAEPLEVIGNRVLRRVEALRRRRKEHMLMQADPLGVTTG